MITEDESPASAAINRIIDFANSEIDMLWSKRQFDSAELFKIKLPGIWKLREEKENDKTEST